MHDLVCAVLEEVRQTLGLHGGGIELISVDEPTGTVTVKLTGACASCALSSITLQHGVETALCKRLPEVRRVVAVA